MSHAAVTRETKLRDIMKTPAGHDILSKALYALGVSRRLITESGLGHLRLRQLQRLTRRFVDEGFIDALIDLLNSEPETPLTDGAPVGHTWWKSAVFYQIYPRSFKDSDGDGIGDLNGIFEKLDYLKALGVNAVWCSPVYDSPNDDNGYDIRDYRAIMKEFGTMEDFDRLLAGLHARGMKLIMDLVFNHSSDEHAWFQSALHDASSPYHDYYIWRPGRGDAPPNNWTSIFSGPAWNYYPERGEWAMHLFSKKQMDFNWDNPALRQALYEITNFWLEKGVDGFRLDVISFISKREGLPDGNELIGTLMGFKGVEHYFYGPHLHEYLREFRAATFGRHDAFTVGECQGTGLEMSKLLTGDDRGELDVVFSFDHMDNPGKSRFQDYRFDLRPMAENLKEWQLHYGSHCWPTVFFDNHDNPRMISKIDPEGRYRWELAKLLTLVQMTLRGTPFLYQGQELGMINAPFASIDDLRDVESLNLYREKREAGKSEREAFRAVRSGTRDHARTPMQWDGTRHAGFTTGDPWILVNPDYTACNAADEENAVDSVLRFTRRMIRLRRENEALVYGSFVPVAEEQRDLLCYYRIEKEARFFVEVNLTGRECARGMEITGYEPLASNYTGRRKVLRPYEANLYRC